MKKIVWRSEKTKDTDKGVEYRCWKTVYSKEGGWVDNDVVFELGKDHQLCIQSGDQWVYLHPEQLSYLLALLNTEEAEFARACHNFPMDDEDLDG